MRLRLDLRLWLDLRSQQERLDSKPLWAGLLWAGLLLWAGVLQKQAAKLDKNVRTGSIPRNRFEDKPGVRQIECLAHNRIPVLRERSNAEQ